MNIAELKVLITGDDSSAQDALSRTSQTLQESSDAAQALSEKLSELTEATALGADATDRQRTLYDALQGKFGDVRAAATQLNAAFDQLDARLKSDEGWSRYSAMVQEVDQKIAQAAISTRDDQNSFAAFGKLFKDLAPNAQQAVVQLSSLQVEAEKLAKVEPTGIAAAIAAFPALSEQAEQATAKQRALNSEAVKLIQHNSELIALGGKGTQAEKELWDVQEGRLKAVSPLTQALLQLQAKALQQTQDQTKLEEALRAAQLEHDKLTAATQAESVSVQVLKKSYSELSDTQKDYLNNELLPLVEANKKISDDQRKQAEIGQELNRELARQYADIARAGSDLGPLDSLLKSILLDTTKLTPENQKLLDQIKKMEPAVEAFQTLAKGITSLFDNVFQDLFQNGFKSFFSNVLQGFQQMIASMAEAWTKQQLMTMIQKGVGGLFGGGSALGSLGFDSSDGFDTFLSGGSDVVGSALSLFARASGGPVSAGQTYLVGEEGPELFVPSGSGAIVPNASLGAGSQVVVNNHFAINTPNPAGFRQSMGQIAAETGQTIQKHLARNS